MTKLAIWRGGLIAGSIAAMPVVLTAGAVLCVSCAGCRFRSSRGLEEEVLAREVPLVLQPAQEVDLIPPALTRRAPGHPNS